MTRHIGKAAFEPPPDEVSVTYQPVEMLDAHGSWTVGRINAWWQAPDRQRWCRIRALRGGSPAHWVVFNPEYVLLLPQGGT
ncbi:hypothetical protein OHV05_14815 [Kitasatospora sp. NBC_00070]|uniref:hypothetical protein n=1 Tax=Kitasatospora sp. NBC_00070 TaxID=2975962 RepID=UPI0032508611